GREERRGRDAPRLAGGASVGVDGAAAREIPDRQVLGADDDLARARRPAAGERARREAQLPAPPPDLHPIRLELLEPGLVLWPLVDLPLRTVALDELLPPGDRVRRGVGALRRPRAALPALAVIRAVVAAECGQPPIAQLPDPRHRRIEEGPVV